MTGYESLKWDLNTCINKMCNDIESTAANEANGNVIAMGTTNWGYIKALMGHLDDPGASILGADLLARVTSAIAIAEALD